MPDSRMRGNCLARRSPGGNGFSPYICDTTAAARRYRSASAARFSASVTTTKCQPCALDPVGAWSAISVQRSTTSGSTGRDRSRRLRTTRVVVSRWSTVARSIGHDYHPTFVIGNEGGQRRRAMLRPWGDTRGSLVPREAVLQIVWFWRAGKVGQGGVEVPHLRRPTDSAAGGLLVRLRVSVARLGTTCFGPGSEGIGTAERRTGVALRRARRSK